jgi:hypothetical protein
MISQGLLGFFLPGQAAATGRLRGAVNLEQQPAIEGLEWFIMVIIGDS